MIYRSRKDIVLASLLSAESKGIHLSIIFDLVLLIDRVALRANFCKGFRQAVGVQLLLARQPFGIFLFLYLDGYCLCTWPFLFLGNMDTV